MERPEEGFEETTPEPVKIYEFTQEHIGQTLKRYKKNSDTGDFEFTYYIRALHIHGDFCWREEKTHLEDDWETNRAINGNKRSSSSDNVYFEPLTEHEANGKFSMNEDDIEKVFASYNSHGGEFVEHIKVLHVVKDKFWCATWIEDKKRWKSEDSVRTRSSTHRIYEEENRLAWAVLNAAPWYEGDEGEDEIPELEAEVDEATKKRREWIPSYAPQTCDHCDNEWCKQCSTDEYLKCDGCGHQYYL